MDEESGCLRSVASQRLGLELITEPSLVRNFLLLQPLPGLRSHYILGHAQTLRDLALTRGDTAAHLVWQGLRSNQGVFDISVELDVTVEGPEITFHWTLENRSGHTIEEFRAPVIGGLYRPEERDQWKLHWPDARGTGQEWLFYRQFPASYLGPADPVWATAYPGSMSMPWIDLYNPLRGYGLYFAVHRAEPRRSALVAEITPGTDYTSRGQGWPRADRIGTPVAASLGWSTFAFTAPGSTFDNGDVVLRFHEGDWSAGADRFRLWYDRTLPAPRTDGWLHATDAWQSTIISYPEDTIGYRFTDLPRMAQIAREHGITVLQIDGWHVGGIDRGYPQYTPDPRLGTSAELRTAIAACQDLGVAVMLFTNLQWVNLETEWWADELRRYAVRDPFGHRHNGSGWEYGTILGLQGEAVPRMVSANPAHARFAEIAVDQMLQAARLGAPGVQIDKLVSPQDVDYHPALRESRGVSMQQGIVETMRRFVEQARTLVPGFDIASESHWDRMVPFMSATYSRFFSPVHTPDFGYVFPEVRQSSCVTGPSDLHMVNNCLRYGHIINLEARCLHGTAADAPITARYAQAILALRRSLRDVLWDGRMQLPSAPGTRIEHDGVLQGRFTSTDGRRTALVLNHWEEGTRKARIVELGGRTSGDVLLYGPGVVPKRISLPGEVTIEPEQVVVAVTDDA